MSVCVWCRRLWWSSAPSLSVGVNRVLHILIKAIQTTCGTTRIPPLSGQQACSFLTFLTCCYYGDNVVILHFSRTPRVWVTLWLHTHTDQCIIRPSQQRLELSSLCNHCFLFFFAFKKTTCWWNVGFNATKQTEYSAETGGHGNLQQTHLFVLADPDSGAVLADVGCDDLVC